MAIQLACDACGKFFRTTDNFAGKKLRCKCGQVLRHLGPLVEAPIDPLMNAETVADVLVVAPAALPPAVQVPVVPAPVVPTPVVQAVSQSVVQAVVQQPVGVVVPPTDDDDSIIVGLRDDEPAIPPSMRDEPSRGMSDEDLDDLAALAADPSAERRANVDVSSDIDSGVYDFAPPTPRGGPSAVQGHGVLASAVSRRR